MNWFKVFIAKHIFGLELIKYIKEPINYLYNVGSINFQFEFVAFFGLMIIGVAIGLQSSILNLFRISIAYLPYLRKTYPSHCQTSNPNK